jgi:hypothetical protein
MLIVIAMVALISSVPIVVLSTAVSQLSLTNENLYWNGAYEAAEAGLNDYTQQLDASSGFAQWVNTNSSFSCTYSPPALPTDPAGDAAFCGWVPVGSTSSNPPEWYEYSLPSLGQGALTLTVSGKAGTGAHAVVRTFTYNVVPTSSFLDNIYWSNYEMSDPTLNPSCASSLGIPTGTSMSVYSSYASYFATTGPPAVWAGTATLSTTTATVTVASTAGIVLGGAIDDTANAIPNNTTVTGFTATTITLSNRPTRNATGDTLDVGAGTVAPYSSTNPWPPPGNCWIWFATGDAVDGPLFSNDTLRYSGTPTFYGSVYSAAAGRTDPPLAVGGLGSPEWPCVDTSYNECGAPNTPPTYRGDEPQPTTGADLQPAEEVGCYITGGTSSGYNSSPANITMSLAASAGTTKVTWSGLGYAYVENASTNTNSCGSSGATGVNGGTITVSSLDAGIIYVNGNVTIAAGSTYQGFLTIVAGDNSNVGPVEWATVSGNLTGGQKTVTGLSSTGGLVVGDPIADSAGAINSGTTVTAISGTTLTLSQAATSNQTSDGLALAVKGNVTSGSKSVTGLSSTTGLAVGEPIAADNANLLQNGTFITALSGTTLTMSQAAVGTQSNDLLYLSPDSTAGDISIDGSITSSGSIVTTTTDCPPISGSLPAWTPCPETDGSDALGLVAGYFIDLPQAPSSSCPNPPVTIEAAMLALSDSVYVGPEFTQGWTNGGQCNLRVFGSIAQDFRGPVGLVGTAGYVKQYVYDASLRVLWPPYYLSASSATWAPVTYEEGNTGTASRALVGDAGTCGTQC